MLQFFLAICERGNVALGYIVFGDVCDNVQIIPCKRASSILIDNEIFEVDSFDPHPAFTWKFRVLDEGDEFEKLRNLFAAQLERCVLGRLPGNSGEALKSESLNCSVLDIE